MDQELKRIKKLTVFMRNMGILNLKSGDLELSLSPSAFHEEHSSESEPIQEAIQTKEFSDEEILFWSSPGVLPESETV